MTRATSLVSEINITPFVDVLLVLLIIFMVVVPSASRGLDAALPQKPSDGPAPPQPTPLIITIDRTGLSLNRHPVPTLPALAARLADAFTGRTDRTVFVRAEGALSYGAVVEVMDAATGAGADRIGLMDSPP